MRETLTLTDRPSRNSLRGSREPELSRVSKPLPLIPSDLEPAAVVQLLGKAPLSSKEAL